MVKPRVPQMPRQPKSVAPVAPAPAVAVSKPPRLKPISTRVYGKGGTPVSSAPDMGQRGAGIGYGGPEDGV